MTHHPWVLTLDPRELGLDTVPKRIGFGGSTQAKWVLTHDPLTLGLEA